MFRQATSYVWRTVVASALGQAGVGCWEYVLKTGELWWSESAGPLVGRPAGYVPGDFAAAERLFVPDSARPPDLDAILVALEEGPVETERQAILPDGSVRWTHHRYFLMVNEDGQPERLAGMMSDIDARKRREREEALLLHAAEELSQSLDVGETLRNIARLVVPDLADWCVVELLDGGTLKPVVNAHIDPEKVRWAEAIQTEFPQDMTSTMGSPNVVRTGEPEMYPDISDDMLVAVAQGDERRLEILREVGYRSIMIVPLAVRGEVIGTVTLVAAESPLRFDERALSFARRLAGQIAIAIDNSSLHSQLVEAWDGQRKAIDTLQRGLSPDPLPDLPGVSLAAHYEIGGTDRVGGDWYDAFATDSGQAVFVIGDVVGKGVPAVAAMSRYRNALKILLMQGASPSEALTAVNRFASALLVGNDGYATVICMTYDPSTRQLEWARAGHPLALLRRPPTHAVERLHYLSDPPLTVDPDCKYSQSGSRVAPGTVLLLYTDGLIETRHETIDTSLDRLAGQMASAPSEPADIIRHLLANLPSYPSQDDVAVLVVCFTD